MIFDPIQLCASGPGLCLPSLPLVFQPCEAGAYLHGIEGCYLGDSQGATSGLGWALVGSEGPGISRLDGTHD